MAGAWRKALACARALHEHCLARFYETPSASAWLARLAVLAASIAPGLLDEMLLLWDAHGSEVNASREHHGCAELVEMCVALTLFWCWRGVLLHDLDGRVSDLEAEACFRRAAAHAALHNLPEQGSMWTSVIDAPRLRWRQALHLAPSLACSSPPLLQPSPAGPSLLDVPCLESSMMQRVASFVTSSSGVSTSSTSAMFFAATPQRLAAIQRATTNVSRSGHSVGLNAISMHCHSQTGCHDVQACLPLATALLHLLLETMAGTRTP